MKIRKMLGAALAASSLAACGSANEKVARADFGNVRALATTGALRIVTERQRRGYQPVVCTEPMPDYAVAFDRKTDVNLKLIGTVTPPATAPASGEGAVVVDAKEKIDEGEGRAAAVLALRDGLYAACQSYANGVIGHDAYAMILSQYGYLLVALVGGGKADAVDDKGKKVTAVTAAVIDSRKAALSTLIVACVSGHDPTRLDVRGENPVLTTPFCRNVMSAALRQATGGGL